jgi:predicted peptidase
MRIHRAFWSVLALTVLLLTRPAAAASINDFLPYTLSDSNNISLLRGRLHVPTEYATDPTTPRPLILFLHGAGESGTNNVAQINGNIDNLLTAAKARGAFLYAPQTNIGWANTTLMSYAMTMIDRAIAEHSVDPSRLYVTGLSMGGGGVWNFLNAYPDRIAAAVPICAVSPSSSFLPASVVDEPVWAFHARNDTTVSPTTTRNVINRLLSEALRPLPAYPALNNFASNFAFDDSLLDLHYTEYRTGGHGIWGQVYNTSAMYDWLFARSSVPEPGTLSLALVGLIGVGPRRRKLC